MVYSNHLPALFPAWKLEEVDMTMTPNIPIGCPDYRRSLRLNRRTFLQAGMLGMAGLSLPQLLAIQAKAAQNGASVDRTKSVIILWMRGGPSQHDMWDPKPDAPAEIRGEFKAIATKVPGIQITELLPLTAQLMDRWSIVRSLAHRIQDGNVGHSDGDQICFTGYPSGRDPSVNIMPSCGSYVIRQKQHLHPTLPAYVMIPKMVPGTGPAWLGSNCKPFETMADPAKTEPFVIPNLGLSAAVTPEQLGDRRQLLKAFDDAPRHEGAAALDKFQAQAMDILTSSSTRAAFDLDKETPATRERYGMMAAFDPKDPMRCGAQNWAQRMLLARRLVEAGVRLVTVDLGWWDFHKQGFDSQRRGFLPRWDRAYSALLEDLEQRGLLSSTLVVAWGEMGRTPVVNKEAGRDHWPYAMCGAFAGGGVRGGRVVGSSDAKGARPRDLAKRPHDVLATIYRHLDIDLTQQALDYQGRPQVILPEGRPIDELF
jgi:uncharacterized protein (DUF1501 family)